MPCSASHSQRPTSHRCRAYEFKTPSFGAHPYQRIEHASLLPSGSAPPSASKATHGVLTLRNIHLTCATQARLLAAEAQTKFLADTAAPLPRSLDTATLLPVTRVYGPDFYSSALGGASLMLQLLRLYVADPVASAQYLKAAIRCGKHTP